MSYLPTRFDTGKSPIVDFLVKYEPQDHKDAREFRADLVKAINYYLPRAGHWTVEEHPDSFYLED